MLPWAPVRQACKTELGDESRHLHEQGRGGASPFPVPIPTSLGLDCSQRGGPSPSPDPSHCRDLFSVAAFPLPPPASLTPLLELGA